MSLNEQVVRNAADITSIALLLGYVADVLPSIATLFTVIWLGIQIWQSKVGQYHVACIRHRIRKWRGRRTT